MVDIALEAYVRLEYDLPTAADLTIEEVKKAYIEGDWDPIAFLLACIPVALEIGREEE